MVEIEKEEMKILNKPEIFISVRVIPNNCIPGKTHSLILIS
jgi:hypothetical protein